MKLMDLGSYKRAEKYVEHQDDGDTNAWWSPWNSLQEPGKRTGWPED